MNVTIPENKMDKNAIIVYSVIIFICIISIIAVLYIQFFDGKIVETVGTLKGKSDYDYNNLRAEFNELFTNNIQNEDEKYQNKKEIITKDLVYTGFKLNENSVADYDIQVEIPYINLKGSKIEEYNNEIKSIFEEKAKSIKNTKNKRSTYGVQYASYLQDGILSLAIKAEIQEGTSAQRTIIKTYNYDLENDKSITFEELLKQKNVDIKYAQDRIDKEAQAGEKKSQDYKAMGYDIYERKADDKMYKVENIEEFYFHDGTIYAIFAYGNDKFTNEVDVAVI